MTVTISVETLLTGAAVLGALGTMLGFMAKGVRWFDRQNQQDADLVDLKDKQSQDVVNLKDKHDEDMEELRKSIREEFAAVQEEQRLLTKGVLACLQGLQEKGCNGPVTATINEYNDYLNEKAHERRNQI